MESIELQSTHIRKEAKKDKISRTWTGVAEIYKGGTHHIAKKWFSGIIVSENARGTNRSTQYIDNVFSMLFWAVLR